MTIEEKLEVNHRFNKYLRENIFITRYFFKVEKETKISKVFPIYIRNIKEPEIDEIRDSVYKQIFSLISVVPTLKELVEYSYYDIPNQYVAFIEKLRNIIEIYKEYKDKNNDDYINKAIMENDKKSFSLYLSSLYDDKTVIVEVKDWKKIDKYLKIYFNCKEDEIETYDYRNYFLERYLNLYNLINFDLRIYRGFEIMDSYNELCNYHYTSTKHNEEYKKALKKNQYIDNFIEKKEDYIELMYFIFLFDKSRYLKERKYIVDFITGLEHLLVRFDPEEKTNIEQQFSSKVRKCCSFENVLIPRDELDDLYDLRSKIVHGNFSAINKKVDKIANKKWYKDYLKKTNTEFGFSSDVKNTDEKEDLIYVRIYEIFNIIYTQYCNNKKMILKIQKLKSKSEIDVFKNWHFINKKAYYLNIKPYIIYIVFDKTTDKW